MRSVTCDDSGSNVAVSIRRSYASGAIELRRPAEARVVSTQLPQLAGSFDGRGKSIRSRETPPVPPQLDANGTESTVRPAASRRMTSSPVLLREGSVIWTIGAAGARAVFRGVESRVMMK